MTHRSDGEGPVPQAAPEEPRPTMDPERIGRYVVESRLGSGGMGLVFRAFDPTIERRVAKFRRIIGEQTFGKLRGE